MSSMASQANPTSDKEIVSMDACALSRAIHSRNVTCVEVMSAYLAHVDRINPKVNAIVAMADRDQVLKQAAERDAQLDKKQSMGPLHGFPQAPKDISPVAGMVTTNGSPIFKGQVTTADSAGNARLRAGGAIFIGRTNSPEFGLGGHTFNPIYGITRNAFNQAKSAGGSSGGAGVSVALNMLPVADGSDMMGSLRTPAAFNNVYGFRTSVGCVPSGPGEEVFMQQFSVVGPMARNIPDLAMLLSVQAGFDPRLPLTRRQDDPKQFLRPLDSDLRGKRIGWLSDLGGHLPMDAGLLELAEKSLEHFKTAGCTVESVTPQFDFEKLFQAWINLRSFTFSGTNFALYDNPEKRALLKPEALWEIERGLKLSGLEVFNASKVRSAWHQTMRVLFEQYDYLVMPATQVFPFTAELHWPQEIAGKKMDTYHRWMESVVPVTMLGLPTLAAPAGFSSTGLPAGIQIIGPTQADWSVLQMGHAYDQASGFAKVRSPLLDNA